MPVMRRPSWLAWLLLAIGLAVFISAGVWQHGKAVWKEGLEREWAAVQAAPVRALAVDDLDRADGYDRVQARGHWLPQRYLLDNQVREARAGVELYAPLRIADGRVLLVSLGWLPYAGARREPPVLPTLVDDAVAIDGWLTPPTAHGLRLGRGWAEAPSYPKLMPYFDLAEVAADLQIELPARVLRAETMPGTALRQDWHPVSSMPPARHLAYAWQWWSLAVAIVIVFLVVHFQRRSKP